MHQYRHEELPPPADDTFWIRVVTLLPGNDEVTLSISHLSINQSSQDRYDYEAVSYAWGEATETRDVKICSPDGAKDHVPVSKNLYDAPLNLSDRPRNLWIDAICIIQQPRTERQAAEKDWSIKRMHLVYGLGSKVLIWLGCSSQSSPLAMRTLNSIGHGITYDADTYILDQRGEAELTDAAYYAVHALLSRSWFSRVWIRQEAFFANPGGTIICGQDEIAVADFCSALLILNNMPVTDFTANTKDFLPALVSAMGIFQHSFKSIPSILFQNRVSSCRFQHDKIYGCLGLMSICGQAQFASCIRVDYEQPVEEVYRQFFVDYLDQKFELGFLNYAGLDQKSSLRLPSWVPDWSVVLQSLDLSFQAACSHAKYAEASYNGNELQVNAVICSKIVKVMPFFGTMLTDQTVDETCRVVCSKLDLHAGFAAVIESVGHAFCAALNNLSIDLDTIARVRTAFVAYLRAFVAKSPKLGLDADTQDLVIRAFGHYAASKWPWFVLEDGTYGVGCAEVQTDDVVAVIIGLSNVVVLRPGESYQLVGSAFVHSFNDGQGLLGQLADHHVEPKLVKSWGTYVPHYVNTNGEVSFWDPRIDWQELHVRNHEPGMAVIREPPGESPRLMPTAAYFRRHGVYVQRISLV